jgi:membrane protein
MGYHAAAVDRLQRDLDGGRPALRQAGAECRGQTALALPGRTRFAVPRPDRPDPMLDTLRQKLPPHVYEWLHDFSGYVWRRFREDRCFDSAGVLAYATVFAMVPLTATVFGILAAFPAFAAWRERLTDFLFTHFVPDAAHVVSEYLYQFADNSTQLTSAGLLGLTATALLVMYGVEDTFNQIWRVRRPRPRLARFLMYWTVLTLGPLLVASSLALSTYLLSLPLAPGGVAWVTAPLLRVLPFVVELAAFTLAFIIIPHRKVKLRHALVGGVLASLLFELAKWALGLYLRQVPSYQQIYGTLAVIPIFLIWVYLSWVVILLGASIAASLSGFRFRPWARRIPPGYELYGLLRLIGRFIEAGRSGESLEVEALRRLEDGISDGQLLGLLESLSEAQILQRTEGDGWVMTRDPASLSLAELCRAAGVNVPLAKANLPGLDDPIGRRAAAAVAALRDPLIERMDTPLAAILRPETDGND